MHVWPRRVVRSSPPLEEWQRRPVLSIAVRFAVVATPIVASFLVALGLSSVLPRPDNLAAGVFWLLVIVVMATVALVGLRRAARRFLPLAALLNIALLFPDSAPSRFAVARMRGSPTELQNRLRAATASGPAQDLLRLQTISQLVLALSVHDRATRGHSERVRVFTELIADELKLPEPDRARLRWAAILHDIGKLGVPASTLNKTTRPTEEEWVALHHHPEEGARLVEPLLPWLAEWGAAVAQHHERYDGTGYPHGLRGAEISLAARIVAAADSYEVMTAPRSYKKPMGVVAARQELVRVAGTQLDPAVVRAFLNVSLGKLWRTVGLAAWIAQLPLFGPLLPRLTGWVSGGATAAAGVSAALVIGTLGGSPVPGGVLALSTSPGTSFAAPAPNPGPDLVNDPALGPRHTGGPATAASGVASSGSGSAGAGAGVPSVTVSTSAAGPGGAGGGGGTAAPQPVAAPPQGPTGSNGAAGNTTPPSSGNGSGNGTTTGKGGSGSGSGKGTGKDRDGKGGGHKSCADDCGGDD